MKTAELKKRLFNLSNSQDFEKLALDIFKYQYQNVKIYQTFCQALNKTPDKINSIEEIPFLPIEFFKSHQILTENSTYENIFTSSGTTGKQTSKHYISDIEIYEKTFIKAFQEFYGKIEDYVVLALLPSYLERSNSSLIYMVNSFINKSKHPESGFFLNNYKDLTEKLKTLDQQHKKILLIGVSFALLDLVEKEKFSLKNTIIMETGGMKGRRKEITREELHQILSKGFGVKNIHSEYGMTELLSQAYSQGNGIFKCPSSMKIFIRETEDPLQLLPNHKTGGLNIIDLANLNSCSFIATQDLGRKISENKFEVLGRFDHSDIRGCNLLML